ncbi:hypothetical protein BGW42_003304 [Actinomortierella wolfii]|nr:hypothetical protein BGW42_003304 [Actinomortierella wolfii]
MIKNRAGKEIEMYCPSGRRACFCLKNTQTKSLRGKGAGNVKLFWSSDCTGNYNVMGSNGFVDNAFWVNSISIGRSGIASEPPETCPDFHGVGPRA